MGQVSINLKKEEVVNLKKRVLTGDRPTGKLHIGHYFGSLKKRVEMQLNKNVENDPYSDLLEIPLTYPQILEIVSETKLTPQDFQLFQKSLTFTEWRKSITIRAQFRDSMLSIPPETIIENRPDDELVKIQKILTDLPNKMPGDDHIKAVINQHLKLIRKRLDEANLPNKTFKH